jgi:HSP20 family protein
MRQFFGGDIDRLFDQFLERMRLPLRGGGEVETMTFLPDVDVIERDNEYLVKVELPGISIEDIDVSVVGDALQIKGEKKLEKEEKEENYYFCERSYGTFLRTIPLPVAIDADKIEAKLDKGVLEVLVPKGAEAKKKKIEIKGEAAGAAKGIEAPRPREERAREKR